MRLSSFSPQDVGSRAAVGRSLAVDVCEKVWGDPACLEWLHGPSWEQSIPCWGDASEGVCWFCKMLWLGWDCVRAARETLVREPHEALLAEACDLHPRPMYQGRPRRPAPSCCSLWSLLAPQQGSFLSTRLLSNDLKTRNDCLDSKYYKNQDIQISLTIFSSFLFNDKIAYKEDSAKQQGMERTYSRIINRASSSAPAAATPSNPDAWWRHEWGNMQPWKDWDDDVLFLFPIRLIVLKNNLVTDNAREKKKRRVMILIYWKFSQWCFFKNCKLDFFFFCLPQYLHIPCLFFSLLSVFGFE